MFGSGSAVVRAHICACLFPGRIPLLEDLALRSLLIEDCLIPSPGSPRNYIPTDLSASGRSGISWVRLVLSSDCFFEKGEN